MASFRSALALRWPRPAAVLLLVIGLALLLLMVQGESGRGDWLHALLMLLGGTASDRCAT